MARRKGATKKIRASERPAAAKTPSGRAVRPFPSMSLEAAVVVPQKIKELNGGNPWSPDDLAASVGMSSSTSKFFYLTAASRDYGLTLGTRNTETISLADLGRAIVYAPDPDAEKHAKLSAFLSIDIFRRVLEHYKGSDLPEMKYLGNTLQREFGLDPQYHEEFSQLFRANCDYLGIKSGIELGGGKEEPTGSASGGPSTVILGEPKSGSALKAFVIMPFVERASEHPEGFFTEVLRSLLTPAGIDAGFKVETANRQGSDLIQSTIVNDLLEADLVIADLTEHNPNVLFELGIRMAQDKPVALVKASGTGRIFDVDNLLRVYEYKSNLWRTTIEKDLPELTKHIQATWESRNSDASYMKILRRVTESKE